MLRRAHALGCLEELVDRVRIVTSELIDGPHRQAGTSQSPECGGCFPIARVTKLPLEPRPRQHELVGRRAVQLVDGGVERGVVVLLRHRSVLP